MSSSASDWIETAAEELSDKVIMKLEEKADREFARMVGAISSVRRPPLGKAEIAEIIRRHLEESGVTIYDRVLQKKHPPT